MSLHVCYFYLSYVKKETSVSLNEGDRKSVV